MAASSGSGLIFAFEFAAALVLVGWFCWPGEWRGSGRHSSVSGDAAYRITPHAAFFSTSSAKRESWVAMVAAPFSRFSGVG
jgi:hypothetical protein